MLFCGFSYHLTASFRNFTILVDLGGGARNVSHPIFIPYRVYLRFGICLNHGNLMLELALVHVKNRLQRKPGI